ncbi:MAG: SET domain-containing protein [Planctomycetota bacterium]|jgi:hypothetical protein
MEQMDGGRPDWVERRRSFRTEREAAFSRLSATTISGRLEELEAAPVRIDRIEGRGRALCAEERFQAGDVVLVEPALVFASTRDGETPRQFDLVRAIAEMSPERLPLVETLHNAHVQDPERLEGDMSRWLAKQEGAWMETPLEQLLHWAGIVATNCFGSRDHAGEKIMAIYPIGAMLSHSCTPNVRAYHEDATICFQALRAIDPGEEITHSYVNTTRNDAERIVDLFRRYRFLCNCGRCTRAAKLLLRGADQQEPSAVTGEGPRFIKDMASQLARLLRDQADEGES